MEEVLVHPKRHVSVLVHEWGGEGFIYLVLKQRKQFIAQSLYFECGTHVLCVITGREGWGLRQPPRVQDRSCHWMQEEVVSTDFHKHTGNQTSKISISFLSQLKRRQSLGHISWKEFAKLKAASFCMVRNNHTNVLQSGEEVEKIKETLSFWNVMIKSWQGVFGTYTLQGNWCGGGWWWGVGVEEREMWIETIGWCIADISIVSPRQRQPGYYEWPYKRAIKYSTSKQRNSPVWTLA